METGTALLITLEKECFVNVLGKEILFGDGDGDGSADDCVIDWEGARLTDLATELDEVPVCMKLMDEMGSEIDRALSALLLKNKLGEVLSNEVLSDASDRIEVCSLALFVVNIDCEDEEVGICTGALDDCRAWFCDLLG